MESMMTTMAPASFYYYNPDPSPETRQHGHFIPHPQQHQMLQYPIVPTLPSTPVYSRPNSSCSQQPMPMKAFTSVPAHMMTPMPSPPAPSAAIVTSNTILSHPIAHKPAIMLETEFCDADGLRYPSTPPLSTTSSISSPGSCDMLATPLNPMFSGLDSFHGLKESCVVDVVSDKLPLTGWSNCSSPPLTPVYIHSQMPKSAPKQISASVSSDLLSVSACPSLSPSPSPYPRSEQDNDFCDPRNLTVSCADGAMSPEFSTLSSICAEDDFIKSESLVADAQTSLLSAADFDQSLTSSLLEDFPELESEDDFLNGLVNLAGEPSPVSSATTPASGDMSYRSRASSAASSAHSEFECGEFFNNTTWESAATEVEHANKRQRTVSGSIATMTAADATSAKSEPSVSGNEDVASVSDNNATNSVTTGSPSSDSGAMPAPTNRRGRKQSLTEDPSKIFACDLCNRRFRRQEHLKRHYRSLHTQDKPFSCHECGKKFSRSDNLAQHARTHGAGAFVMNLYEDPEMVAAATGYPPHPMYAPHAMAMAEDYTNMGRVLFQVAAEVPGSNSDLSSDDDAQGKKKRKRMD